MVRVTDHRATDSWRWRGPWHSNNAHVFSGDTLDQLGGKPVVLVHAAAFFLRNSEAKLPHDNVQNTVNIPRYTRLIRACYIIGGKRGYSDVLRPRASAPMAGDIGGQSSISSFSVRLAPAFAVA
ncbi:MAG: hypothetical protein ACYCVY_10820 [Acidiferrobacteraceae bacterium]